MTPVLDSVIHTFCEHYGLNLKGLEYKNKSKVPIIILDKPHGVISGLINLCLIVSPKLSKEDSALFHQWSEYAIVYLNQVNASKNTSILLELNTYLVDKVYFVGNQLTPVDILMFLFIYDLIFTLSLPEKNKFIHVCRWFDHIQCSSGLLKRKELIPFSRTRIFA